MLEIGTMQERGKAHGTQGGPRVREYRGRVLGAQVAGYLGSHVLGSPRRARELRCVKVGSSKAWVHKDRVLRSSRVRGPRSRARESRAQGFGVGKWWNKQM